MFGLLQLYTKSFIKEIWFYIELLYKIAQLVPKKNWELMKYWIKAEKHEVGELKKSGCDWEIYPGEGAFYVPKMNVQTTKEVQKWFVTVRVLV